MILLLQMVSISSLNDISIPACRRQSLSQVFRLNKPDDFIHVEGRDDGLSFPKENNFVAVSHSRRLGFDRKGGTFCQNSVGFHITLTLVDSGQYAIREDPEP